LNGIPLTNPPNVYPVNKYTWLIAVGLAIAMWAIVNMASGKNPAKTGKRGR